MAHLWNLNAVSTLLVLTIGTGCVLGDYKPSSDYTTHRGRPTGPFCENLSPQHYIDMEHIKGLWYGVEVLEHTDGVSGSREYDTCIRLHLDDVTDELDTRAHLNNRDPSYEYGNHRQRAREQTKYLRMNWDEHAATFDYLLSYNESQNGLWSSAASHIAQMPHQNQQYRQFTGNVQVIKAVGNHIVLTFCQSTPMPKIFTVILSRHLNGLSFREIESIKKLLSYRFLNVDSVRRVCLNGASATFNSKTGLLLLLVSVFAVVRSAVVGSKRQ